ncbi:MAG TPA: lysylphosphatidylglycerol synthase transmembrane domain-containing protein [Dehalococcoidia bacterium]|nr:lysylphosphatidylglycerol synthase transmembrane domain-containing protein [Dehalococcoidia bacterium]
MTAVWARRSLPFLRYGLQLGFAAAILGLLLWRVDLGSVRDELSGASLWWLPLAFLLNLASDFFRAIRWREFFRPMKQVRVAFLYGVAILGVACNLALPLRAGEFVRLQLLRRRTGLELPKVIATLLSEKLMDTVAFSTFLVLGLLAFEEARFLWPLALVYIVALIAGVFTARWLARRSETGSTPLTQPDGRWRLKAANALHSFGGGLQSFRNTRSLAVIALCSLAAWVCEAGMYWAAGESLGLDLNPAAYLLIVVAATIAVSVPITQAGLGIYELTLTALLVAFDVDKSQAAAFAIYAHIILAVPYFMTGPLAAFALRVSPGDVLFIRDDKRDSAQAPAQE